MANLYLVGLGPGSLEQISRKAYACILKADVIVGYAAYIRLIKPILGTQKCIATGMTKELERANIAIEEALAGKNTAMVCSGDSGVYAMAPLVFELCATKYKDQVLPKIIVLPGITAAISASSLVGAPLGHDSCTISLSDLLTPWEIIAKRIALAAQADFVISFYNPRSKKRQQQILLAQKILLQYKSKKTPVAIITAAYREAQSTIITDLENFTQLDFGMQSTIIIGNSNTYRFKDWLITPRGYTNKYDLSSGKLEKGQKRGLTLV